MIASTESWRESDVSAGLTNLQHEGVHIPTLDEIGGLHASSNVELGNQIRTVLRLLLPQQVVGQRKKRFGRANDGGYVHLDDFRGVDTALSLGVNDDVSWDRDVADCGLKIFQFDHTVDDPSPDDDRMIFSKIMIAAHPGAGCATLNELVAAHDKGANSPNIFLKMDIEGYEWPVIEETDQHLLGRFTQIACEMHLFEHLPSLEFRQGFYRSLRKLNLSYAPIHIHANNHAGYSIVAGVPIANVLEVTWANRSIYSFRDTEEVFPTHLDQPCNASAPDHFLGSFRF